jgi:hypothetical protein
MGRLRFVVAALLVVAAENVWRLRNEGAGAQR